MNNQENNSNINQNQAPIVNMDNQNTVPTVVDINSNTTQVSSTPIANIDNNVQTTTSLSNIPTLETNPTPNISVAQNNTEVVNNINLSVSNTNRVNSSNEPLSNQSVQETTIVQNSTEQLVSNSSVETPLQKDFIDEELEKQKNKYTTKTTSTLFVILVLAVISGVIYQLCFRYNNKLFDNTNNNSTSTASDDVLDKEIIKLEDRTGIFTFSGTYMNENNDSVVEICAINENKAKVSLTYDNSTSVTYANLENDILLEENEKMSNDYSIKIEKLDNQINITSSSNDENSILNKCNGTYDKKEYESKGWYGTYVFGSSVIYIDEYDIDSVIVNITNIDTEHIIDKVTNNTLEFESNKNNIEVKLKIEKSNNGIIVTASSSDAQSEYNKISGNYLIKK